jgi:hypothetical protein
VAGKEIQMNRWRLTLVILAVAASVAGCGDDDDAGSGAGSSTTSTTSSEAPRSNSDVVHTYEGKEFTCEETLGIDPEVGCSDDIVAVWEEWGQDLGDYVNSGRLGPLNDESSFSFEDAAYAGVIACVIREGGGDEQDFIDFMRDPENNTQLEELSGTELLPAWFAADRVLCPTGFATGSDMTTP